MSLEYLSYVLSEKLRERPSAIVILRSIDVDVMTSYLAYHLPDQHVYPFFGWDVPPYSTSSPSHKNVHCRLNTLSNLIHSKGRGILVTDMVGAIQKVVPKDDIIIDQFTLKVGNVLKMDALIHFLNEIGYQKRPTVYEAGDYSIRGHLVDIFPVGYAEPIRVDLFGDDIDVIKTFDPLTQKSTDTIQYVNLTPCREILLTPNRLDIFKKKYPFGFSKAYDAITNGHATQGMEFWMPLFFDSLDTIQSYMEKPVVMSIEGVSFENDTIEAIYHKKRLNNYPVLPPDDLYTSVTIDEVIHDSSFLKQNYSSPIFSIPQHKDETLFIEALKDKGYSCPSIITKAPFDKGFDKPSLRLITFFDIVEDGNDDTKNVQEQFFDEAYSFEENHYYVHVDHGIGQYKGLETIEFDGILHEFLCLMYEGQDKLLVPITHLNLLKYFADESSMVTLDKLGARRWAMRKENVQKRLVAISHDLIQLSAKRCEKTIEPFIMCDDFSMFCNRFAYQTTTDQQRCIDDVVQDLLSTKPMDRLLCADVGFGKTEVAMRAACLTVLNDKQVALLCPTTLLCRQHYQNFKDRFDGFPFNIDQLSRMVPPGEASAIRQHFNDQKIDILIATHSLLNDKMSMKNVGLIIIDEEHHFGVKQKEFLKSLQDHVHVLTLSATPIPRTLQMSLTGVRDLSLISTPPKNRVPVKTMIGEYDESMIQDAIEQEHQRGGQIFMVTRFIEDLPSIEKVVQKLCPSLSYRVANGQMKPKDLETIMEDFYHQKFDILISTNIIESGIDVANANTMIIFKADTFGLSQVYQLRGRVGRSYRRGYAYLLMGERPSKDGQKRLQVMETLDFLGASFKLASYDLDIRGAGNLVGEEQSGYIKDVGIDMYQSLLTEAIAQAKGEQLTKTHHMVKINVNIPTYIPTSYVEDVRVKLGLYKRINKLKNRSMIHDFKRELQDRFGDVPTEVELLLDVMDIKNLSDKRYVQQIDGNNKLICMTFLPTFFDQGGMTKLQNLMNIDLVKKLGQTSIDGKGRLILKGNFAKHSFLLKTIRFVLGGAIKSGGGQF